MKILQIIPYFYPAWSYGGTPRNTYGLCKELAKRGHYVTVFTTDVYDEHNRIKENFEMVDGIRIRRFRNLNNYVAFHHHIFLSWSIVGAIKEDLKNYDVVHLNEYRTLQNMIAHDYALQYNVPYVLQAHGSLVNMIAKKELKNIFDILWGRNLLKDASRLVAVSNISLNQYKNKGMSEDKIDIVPNGIDLNYFNHLPIRGVFRSKYGLKENNQVILFMGRLHKIKGIDLLIFAFAELSKEFNNTRLVIVGSDDGYLPTLQKLVSELKLEKSTIFAGMLNNDDKISAYIDADVFALTSSYEVFGLSVLEALACGLPVVITDRCGIADVIKDKAGLVVPYEVYSLKEALCEMLADDKKRQQYGLKGKMLVKDYGLDIMAERMEKVYEKCLGAK